MQQIIWVGERLEVCVDTTKEFVLVFACPAPKGTECFNQEDFRPKRYNWLQKLFGAQDETIQEACDRIIDWAMKLDLYLDDKMSQVEEIERQKAKDEQARTG